MNNNINYSTIIFLNLALTNALKIFVIFDQYFSDWPLILTNFLTQIMDLKYLEHY